MSEINLDNIKDKLIAEREILLAKLGSNDLSVDSSETPDPVDTDDEYGTCQNCEKAINPKRLDAVPWARYCLSCQELVEQGLLDED